MPGAVFISVRRGGVVRGRVFGSAGASPSRGGVRGLVEFGSAGASPSRGGRAREAGLSHEDSADDLSDGFYVLNTDKFLVQS